MLKLLQMDLKNFFQISFIHSGAVYHVCFKIDGFEFKYVLSLLHVFFAIRLLQKQVFLSEYLLVRLLAWKNGR